MCVCVCVFVSVLAAPLSFGQRLLFAAREKERERPEKEQKPRISSGWEHVAEIALVCHCFFLSFFLSFCPFCWLRNPWFDAFIKPLSIASASRTESVVFFFNFWSSLLDQNENELIKMNWPIVLDLQTSEKLIAGSRQSPKWNWKFVPIFFDP